jgi:hypothetical protein
MINIKSEVVVDNSMLLAIEKRLLALNGAVVEYGFYSDQWHDEAQWDMASLALTMERGSTKHNIPSRPFMAQSGIYFTLLKMNIVKLAYNQYLAGKTTLMSMLGRVGVAAKQNVSNTITFQNFVALKPATIAAKGFDTILIESGTLEKSVTIKIKP